MKQINATVQLDLEGTGCFLQQMQPAAELMIIWAITRANPAIDPRAKAGLLGYEHVSRVVSVTSETCRVKKKYKLKP